MVRNILGKLDMFLSALIVYDSPFILVVQQSFGRRSFLPLTGVAHGCDVS